MMSSRTRAVLVLLLPLVGCQSTGDLPLLFGQSDTIGISIGASPAEQSGELTLGYKSRNVAVIPLVTMQPDGAKTAVTATVTDEAGNVSQDAMSVLGQFEADARAAPARASLGKFFATGLAARYLAQGFADELAGRAPADGAATGGGN
jgi:hypothetical protein